MRAFVVALAALFVFLVAASASAHGMRTAAVRVEPLDAERIHVSVRANMPVQGVQVVIEGCAPESEGAAVWRCADGWAGRTVRVVGLGPIASEAVISLTHADGRVTTHLAQPSSPSWVLPADAPSRWAVARQYVRLGVTHIATGWDHLLFLFGLVLCLRRWKPVLLAETAFTLSHSVSFSASALGWVQVSPRWAEACIAFSLLLVALDVGRTTPRDGRRVAGLAFVFGLVHGLGFAGGLREVGIPEGAVLPALAGFAAGVELGQIAFLAIVLVAVALAARLRFDRKLSLGGAYAIGIASAFWLIARASALFYLGGRS